MFIVKLAFKNLWRYKRRSLITAFAIAIGLMFYIFMDSMIEGAAIDSETNLRNLEVGDAQIHSIPFWENKDQLPVHHIIEDTESVERYLTEQKIGFTTRTVTAVDLITGGGESSRTSILYTVDIQTDGRVFESSKYIVEGSWVDPQKRGVVLGQWVAQDFNVVIGDFVTLSTRSKYGSVIADDFEVIGLINTENPTVNKNFIYISKQDGDSFLGMEGGYNEICLRFPPYADIEKQTKILSSDLNQLSVQGWKSIAPDALQASEGDKAFNKIILILIFIIAAIGISNTMIIAVYERIREIGMLRALGLSNGKIVASFVLEAGAIGLIGSAAGLVLGALVNVPLVIWGIDYSIFVQDYDFGYRISGVMKGLWNLPVYGYGFLLGTGLSAFFALFPARMAFKKSIPQSLSKR